MARLTKETLLEWYRQMTLIRQFETRCDELYQDKKITGVYMHLYSGHEATGVGALAALGDSRGAPQPHHGRDDGQEDRRERR